MILTREEAKDYCKDKLSDYLQRQGIPTSKKFTCYKCNHKAMSYNPHKKQLHCFHCEACYDIFDLVGELYGLTDSKAIFDRTYEEFGIEIASRSVTPKGKPLHEKKPAPVKEKAEMIKEIKLDIEEPIEEAHKELLSNAEALKHITDRGISKATIERYRIGYSKQGHNALLKDYEILQTKSKKENYYKYVFPFIGINNKAEYFLTEITDRALIDDYNGKYRLLNKGNDKEQLPMKLFNERYLYEDSKEPVFICEGIYDALSVEEAGGRAIALNGVGQNRILELCEKHTPAYVYIYTDNDEAGQQAVIRITEGLNKLGIKYACIKNDNGKDANEALIDNREAFIEKIRGYISEAQYTISNEEEEARQAYLSTSAGHYIDSFIESIKASKAEPYYPTGFSELDKLIDGGLRAGLYTIGAISSLGKTTFVLQIADYIAKCGYDVLYFSLEMARREIMAKSISRETMAIDELQTGEHKNAKTTLGILTGKRYDKYSKEENELISSAVDAYSQYADHLYIYEGVGNIGVAQVRSCIEQHKKYAEETGRRPLVVVDYIQILAAYMDEDNPNRSYTDKQTVDKNVLELKRMSRDYDIPIVGISSFNRENYTEPVNMAAFKESGAIEYSADVLIGLQYKGMDYRTITKQDKEGRSVERSESQQDHAARVAMLIRDNIDRAKEGKAQLLEVKILKNRNGSKGAATLEFYPMFNRFVEPAAGTSDALYFVEDKYNEAQRVIFKPN